MDCFPELSLFFILPPIRVSTKFSQTWTFSPSAKISYFPHFWTNKNTLHKSVSENTKIVVRSNSTPPHLFPIIHKWETLNIHRPEPLRPLPNPPPPLGQKSQILQGIKYKGKSGFRDSFEFNSIWADQCSFETCLTKNSLNFSWHLLFFISLYDNRILHSTEE